jgi:hypothetical protein
MNWPNVIDVLVEGDDNERKAKKVGFRAIYNACEYKDDQERCFFIDTEYMQECLKEKKLVKIPLQVVTQLANMREKLEFGRKTLEKQAKQQQSGLIIPDGIQV